MKKDWIEKCHRDRKRYPWRRYCLDRNDQGDESEVEIWEEGADAQDPDPIDQVETKSDDYDKDTDDEIEDIRNKGNAKINDYDKDTDDEIEDIKKNEKSAYDQETDEEIENEDPYEADTDVDEDNCDTKPAKNSDKTDKSNNSYLNFRAKFCKTVLCNCVLAKEMNFRAKNGEFACFVKPFI